MDKEFDSVLIGGEAVTAGEIKRVDIGIKNGSIKKISEDLSAYSSYQVLDVSGRLLLPGVIDVHVHPVYTDDMEACSRVAAYGGTTTLIHFAYAFQGQSLESIIEKFIQRGMSTSRLDFGLHCGLFDAQAQIDEILKVMSYGVSSFKFFMPYIKQGWSTDDYHLIKAMDILAGNGGLAMVHAENGGAVDYLEDKYLVDFGKSTEFHHLTRPPVLEEEAIFRAICLAEVTKCPLYIPHVTAARSLRPIKYARQAGQVVYAESCPHYLTLNDSVLKELGALAKVGPPIRTEEDRVALWQALRDNTLQVVSSDHAAKIKNMQDDFWQQGFGSPQLETMLPLVYDQGVNSGYIGIVRLVQVLSENPARIFGLYPQKGSLTEGSDADIVVFDPSKKFTIRKENQHSNVGYSLYEGYSVVGWPEKTFQRGRLAMSQGEILADPGDGEFLHISPNGQFL